MKNVKRYLTAIKVEDFESILNEIVVDTGIIDEIPVIDSLGRTAVKDIKSPIAVPKFPKSKVDGYAVKSEGTFQASENSPIALEELGNIEIGTQPNIKINSKLECAYVPTGGPIPEGADAVVKIEYTTILERAGKKFVEISQPVGPGDGMIPAGADLISGEIITKKGTVFTIPMIGSLSAAGLTNVPAYARLKVGVFSSGNELLEPGEPLTHGKIYDVNSRILHHLIKRTGSKPVQYGIVPDELSILEDVFATALKENDIIVCSGGTSKGRGDLMPLLLEKHPELSTYVHGVRIKPGKPLIFALLDSKPVFILPGNPTSAMMTFIRLLSPHFKRWNRLPYETNITKKGILTERIYSELGRRELKAVIFSQPVGQKNTPAIVTPILKGSETITTLLNANGYIEIPENVERLEKGDHVEVILF